MAEDTPKDKPLVGELLRKEAERSPARSTPKSRTIDRLLSMLSMWPFRNRSFAKSLETATDVIEKQNKLEETVIRHARTRGQLNDLGVTLQGDRDQRHREFLEERKRLNDAIREHESLEQQNQIYKNKQALELKESEMQNKYESEMKELDYKKRLHALKKELADLEAKESAQTKKTRGPSTTSLFREKEKIDKEVAKRKAAIESGKGSVEEKKTSMKLLDGWREEMLERAENQFRRRVDKDEAPEK